MVSFRALQEKNALCTLLHLAGICFLEMLWNARIAADFGLRSFEVLGFGRATRFVSAMPVLTSASGAQNVWVSNQRALSFLVWCNLLVLPQFCPRGHQWSFGGNEKGYQHLMCSSKLPVQMSEGGDEEEEHPTKRCGHKMSWRVQGTLPHQSLVPTTGLFPPEAFSCLRGEKCRGRQTSTRGHFL